MTEIYLHFLLAHYGLYGHAPVVEAIRVRVGTSGYWAVVLTAAQCGAVVRARAAGLALPRPGVLRYVLLYAPLRTPVHPQHLANYSLFPYNP